MRSKKLMISGFLLTIGICVTSVFGAQEVWKPWKAISDTTYPQKTLDVSIDLSQQERFFEQLGRYADAHDFRMHIGPTTPAGDTFNINMSRRDVMVIVNNVVDGEKFHVAFYDENFADPASEATIDGLFNDLKWYISEIPNSIMTEELKSWRITLDEGQREELFAGMRKMADQHSLEFQLSLSPDKTLFLAEIYGDGFHLMMEPAVGSPGEITITFFIDYHKVPTPTSLATVDQLVIELEGLLEDIPNVTIAEE